MPQVRQSVPGPKKTGDPDFLYAAPDTTTCAAFSKESRMKFANATKINRKSGVAQWREICGSPRLLRVLVLFVPSHLNGFELGLI